MNQTAPTHAPAANPLFELQQTLYASGNYTRRRLHRDRLNWVTSAIDRYSKSIPISRAIEYGPGSGIYLPVLSARCEHVTAADVERAYLEGVAPLAEGRPDLELLVDDIQDSSIDKDSFGLVLCSEVLEHVPDPERALATLYRILAPGGVAIVTTPQRYSIMELCCKIAFLPGVIDLVRLVYREPVLPTGHISLMSHRTLSSFIASCGFEIAEQAKSGLYLPLIAEFGGPSGGRAIEALERRLADTSADNAFWTQAFVLRKPVA